MSHASVRYLPGSHRDRCWWSLVSLLLSFECVRDLAQGLGGLRYSADLLHLGAGDQVDPYAGYQPDHSHNDCPPATSSRVAQCFPEGKRQEEHKQEGSNCSAGEHAGGLASPVNRLPYFGLC